MTVNTSHTTNVHTNLNHQLRLFPSPCLSTKTPKPPRPKPSAPTPPALDSGLCRRHAVPVFRLQLVRERDHLTEQITSPAEAARVACEILDGADREVFLVLALSTSNRIVGAHAAHTGTIDASIASPREVFKFALLCNARSVIVAHNHPSGNLEPSRADVAVTKQIRQAGEALGIPLRDSLVTSFDGRYTSLAERGLM
jgi:DNA repair protein RadC